MMPDRSQAPPFHPVSKFKITRAETFNMGNGIPLFTVNSGNHDIIKLEVILKSGKWYERVNGLSTFTVRMITEGTINKSSSEISEIFDFFGAQIQISPGLDYQSISIFTLNKHFGDLLPLLTECLTSPVFPERELIMLKDRQVQQIKVNNEKNSYLASKWFRKLLYGSLHPYGQALEEEDINAGINSESLSDFYKNNLLNGVELILSGKLNNQITDRVIDTFAGIRFLDNPSPGILAGEEIIQPAKKVILREDRLQSSIRYGKRIVNKNHPDYISLLVLNEIFGGYFGSRLMKNIREDKGYTYGIHSSLVNMLQDSYFVVGADVKLEFTEETITEINREISVLQTELVGDTELDTVRNYMLGSFLSSLETSFSQAEKFKSVHFFGLDYDYYDRYIQTIRNITSAEIRELANRYLNPADFTLVIAGKES